HAARRSPSSTSPNPTSAILLQAFPVPASSRSALVCPCALQIPRRTSRASSGCWLIWPSTPRPARSPSLTVVPAPDHGERRLSVLLSAHQASLRTRRHPLSGRTPGKVSFASSGGQRDFTHAMLTVATAPAFGTG